MSRDVHAYAEQLILESRVGAIPEPESEWLEIHLRGCTACSLRAAAADAAVQALRSMTARLNPALVEATRVRVRARARELHSQRAPQAWLWVLCALSWAWIAESAPRLWHGFAWVAVKVGVPSPLWQMAFALWWAIPALVIAAAVSSRSLQEADSAAGR